MNEFRNIPSAVAFAAIGFLILIQRDELGDLLVNGWHGLALACTACFAAAIAHVAIACQRFADEADAERLAIKASTRAIRRNR